MEKKRCRWASDVEAIYVRYHDEEWGVAVHEDKKLFEMLVLESFQAGLSWLTILKKRESFRQAFDGFDVHKVAAYDEVKIQQLLADKSIVRNRRKIEAAIQNAKVFLQIQAEFGSFANYLWGFSKHRTIYEYEEGRTHNELSDRISKDLQTRGMRFVGTIIMYSYLQAVGVINDHEPTCFLHKKS